MAAEILTYVNDLFARNALEGRRFIDAYRSGGVTKLVFRNVGSVSESLSTAFRSDGVFRAEVIVWWARHKAEYGLKRNKFEVLAQSILSDWIGKFLFAHVLQGQREEAYAVNGIGSGHTPEQALAVFQELSEKCNFYTIFERRLGSEHLSNQAWLDLWQLNAVLSDLRLGGIEQLQLSAKHPKTRQSAPARPQCQKKAKSPGFPGFGVLISLEPIQPKTKFLERRTYPLKYLW